MYHASIRSGTWGRERAFERWRDRRPREWQAPRLRTGQVASLRLLPITLLLFNPRDKKFEKLVADRLFHVEPRI